MVLDPSLFRTCRAAAPVRPEDLPSPGLECCLYRLLSWPECVSIGPKRSYFGLTRLRDLVLGTVCDFREPVRARRVALLGHGFHGPRNFPSLAARQWTNNNVQIAVAQHFGR